MLQALLDTMDGKEISSLEDISRALHVETETIKVALEYLEREGYIKKALSPPSCPAKSCSGCSGCAPVLSLPLLWEKT